VRSKATPLWCENHGNSAAELEQVEVRSGSKALDALSWHVGFNPTSDVWLRRSETTLWTDFVEEVGEQFEIKRSGHSNALDCEPLMVSGWVRAWHRYQLRQLSEILGGCCKKELIARTIRSS
jgi:hypothetical protein